MNLKLLFSWWFVRRVLWRKSTLSSFLSASGGLYGALVGVQWVWPAPGSTLNLLPYGIAAVLALLHRLPRKSATYLVQGTRTKVVIRAGDIFDTKGAMVVAATTTFDTEVSDRVISPRSLQGMATRRLFGRSSALEQLVNGELGSRCSSERLPQARNGRAEYPIGTTIRLESGGRPVYLVAVTEMSSDFVASTDISLVQQALPRLWACIGERNDMEPVAVALLGTGHGRIQDPYDIVVREIVRSFVSASRERFVCPKLTVVVWPQDILEHDLDFDHLCDIARHECGFVEGMKRRGLRTVQLAGGESDQDT